MKDVILRGCWKEQQKQNSCNEQRQSFEAETNVDTDAWDTLSFVTVISKLVFQG
jgi:hypothetical protein